MTKQQLIKALSSAEGITKDKAEKVINTLTEIIVKRVKMGDDVKLAGFGAFTKSKHKARVGRNPKTGKQIKIPARWNMRFRQSKDVKAKMN